MQSAPVWPVGGGWGGKRGEGEGEGEERGMGEGRERVIDLQLLTPLCLIF